MALTGKRKCETVADEEPPRDTKRSAYSAATSSSSVGGEYEVFLSFRGQDTRYTFTDYLYTSLDGAGIRTFRDKKLPPGEEISPELLKAIKESKILIPILSKNYAGSKWCMFELAKMVECHKKEGKTILPIFYDVKPSDARYQKGEYEEAFRQHEDKFDEGKVQLWKDAMTVVSNLEALELKEATNGREGELAKMVVKQVLVMLKKNYMTLPDDLVGIDHHVSKMEKLLNVNSNGIRIVGILGMGGIGKTTISKVVFNRLCDSFDSCCFLDDVRERSKHHNGVLTLQSELVSKITKKISRITKSDEGTKEIKDAVHKKKVLIVLDDIESISQLKQFLGDCSSFCQGSKIMITTRNKDVLDNLQKTCRVAPLLDYKCYEPAFMNDNQSLILFCKHAFKEKSPPQEYVVLSKDFVSTASGLPLFLVTIGTSLFGESRKKIWEENVKKLKKFPNEVVLKKLRTSFDPLEDRQKQIFLDIACVLVGGDKDFASYMWTACEYFPEIGIDTLICRSLIRVGDKNDLRMHNQLADIGKQIVREENLREVKMRSRVWDLKEAVDILKEGQGSKKIEVLTIRNGKHDRVCFQKKDFRKMRNLRFLALENVELDGDFTDLFPRLRFLEWFSSVGECIPTNLCLRNLVYLKLSIDKFMDGREIGLCFSINQARNLQALVLENCNNIRKLVLSTFEYLEILVIRNCKSLWEVGNTLDLSYSRLLRQLRVHQSMNLTEITGLENLTSLEVLYILDCGSLEKLPDLLNLPNLKELVVTRCEKLVDVKCLGLVLESLVSSDCEELAEIKVSTLVYLDISFCNAMEYTIMDFSSLVNLMKLKLSGLKHLTEITGLEELKSLQVLDVSDCKLLEKLPDLRNITNLRELNTLGCAKLPKIEGLSSSVSLKGEN